MNKGFSWNAKGFLSKKVKQAEEKYYFQYNTGMIRMILATRKLI